MGIGGAAVLPDDPGHHHRRLPPARAGQGHRCVGRRRRRRRGPGPGARRHPARASRVEQLAHRQRLGLGLPHQRPHRHRRPVLHLARRAGDEEPAPSAARHPRAWSSRRAASSSWSTASSTPRRRATGSAPSVVVPMAAGIVLIAFFLWTEARSDHASFDVSLFRNRGYAVSLTAVSLAFFAMSGITFSLPFYLQILRGYTTLAAGLCFLPFALGQLIAAPRSAGDGQEVRLPARHDGGPGLRGRLDAPARASADGRAAVGAAAGVLPLRLRHGQRHRARLDGDAERAAAGAGRRRARRCRTPCDRWQARSVWPSSARCWPPSTRPT